MSQTRQCGLEFLAVAGEEGGRLGPPELLFALEQHRDIDRQTAMHGEPGAAGLKEGHDLPLIVGGAAGDDDLA